MTSITVVDHDGQEHTLAARQGLKIMEIIRDAGLPIEASCGGCCSCSTCHVYVDPDWKTLLEPCNEEELETLEMAFDTTENSRLACQIAFKAEMDGMRLTLGAL